MSHNIEIVEGNAQMAFAGDVPWHGLGQKVPSDLTPRQIQEAAGVDWRVVELPTYAEFRGEQVYTGWKTLLRETDQKVLTQVGPGWIPVQNDEAFDFFADFVAAGDMEMHTAGSLNDGKLVWALAKVNDSFELANGDRVDSYLLFSNPHEYGRSLNVKFTPIRVVCNNTLTLSLRESSSTQAVKLNHRKAFDPEQVKKMLGVATDKLARYRQMAEMLQSKQAPVDAVNEFLAKVFGTSKKESKMLTRTGEVIRDHIIPNQPGADMAGDTWWNVFNGVTYWTDHLAGRSVDTRMQSSWFGANERLKTKALETALEMADA